MRNLFLAAPIVLAASLAAGVTLAQESIPGQLALNEYREPLGSNFTKVPRSKNIIAFCGQCTKDADCGVGYKCAGKPNCLECTKK